MNLFLNNKYLLLVACIVSQMILMGSPLFATKFKIPQFSDAGKELAITVLSGASESDLFRVVHSDSYVSRSFNLLVDEKNLLKVPKRHMTKSGLHLFELLDSEGKEYSLETYVQPGRVKSPIHLVSTANSILANLESWTQVLVLSFDQYLNPIEEGQEVDLSVFQPGGGAQTESLQVNNMIARGLIFSGSVAGRTVIKAEVANTSGESISIQETPSSPADFEIYFEKASFFGDGRHKFVLFTSPLKDLNGNPLADGTVVEFEVFHHSEFYGRYQSMVVNGIAKTVIFVPDHELKLKVVAFIYEKKSNNSVDLKTDKNSSFKFMSINYVKDEISNMILFSLGPIRDQNNMLFQDKSVIFRVLRDGELVMSKKSQCKNGLCELKLRYFDFESGIYTITVDKEHIKATRDFEI